MKEQVCSLTHAHVDMQTQCSHPLEGPVWLSEPLLLDRELSFGMFPWSSCKVVVPALGTCLVTVSPLQEGEGLLCSLGTECILGIGTSLGEFRGSWVRTPS